MDSPLQLITVALEELKSKRTDFKESLATCKVDRQRTVELLEARVELLFSQNEILCDLFIARVESTLKGLLSQLSAIGAPTSVDRESAVNHRIEDIDSIQTELQCTICSELMVGVASLNCTHSFCTWCINEWRKNHFTCPICRALIIHQVRCLALDNVIDVLVNSLPEDVANSRRNVVQQRAAVEREDRPIQHNIVQAGPGLQGPRSPSLFIWQITPVQQVPAPPPPAVVVPPAVVDPPAVVPRRTPRAPNRPRSQQQIAAREAREQRQRQVLVNFRLRQQAARARIMANREQQRSAPVQWRY